MSDLFLEIYIIIGLIYMIRNLLSNMLSSYRYTYNKLTLPWKLLSMISDLLLWPIGILLEIRRKSGRS